MGSRSSRTSAASDFVDLISRLPWWACIAVAVASYLVLHPIATSPLPAPALGAPPGAQILPALWRGVASGAQYLVPILCIAAAIMSALRRRKSRELADRVRQSAAPAALNEMSWQQFELLVGELFRRRGFRVQGNTSAGPDDGVDLVLHKATEKYLVQCKQWRANRVGVEVVRELYGLMAAQGAAGGFVVTSGRFSDEARRFADGRNLELLDGDVLHTALRAQAAPPLAGTASRPPAAASSAEPAPSVNTTVTPSCPSCGGPMVSRLAKRGQGAGTSFWGCASYPRCKGTRPAG